VTTLRKQSLWLVAMLATMALLLPTHVMAGETDASATASGVASGGGGGGGKEEEGKITLKVSPTSKPFVGDEVEFTATITPPKDGDGQYTHSRSGVGVGFSHGQPASPGTTNAQGKLMATWTAVHPGNDTGELFATATVEEQYRGGYRQDSRMPGEDAGSDRKGRAHKRIQVMTGSISLAADEDVVEVEEEVTLTARVRGHTGPFTYRFYEGDDLVRDDDGQTHPDAEQQTSATTATLKLARETPQKIRFRVEVTYMDGNQPVTILPDPDDSDDPQSERGGCGVGTHLSQHRPESRPMAGWQGCVRPCGRGSAL
jgi:hypothetical protein